jgi:hypothetical protein
MKFSNITSKLYKSKKKEIYKNLKNYIKILKDENKDYKGSTSTSSLNALKSNEETIKYIEEKYISDYFNKDKTWIDEFISDPIILKIPNLVSLFGNIQEKLQKIKNDENKTTFTKSRVATIKNNKEYTRNKAMNDKKIQKMLKENNISLNEFLRMDKDKRDEMSKGKGLESFTKTIDTHEDNHAKIREKAKAADDFENKIKGKTQDFLKSSGQISEEDRQKELNAFKIRQDQIISDKIAADKLGEEEKKQKLIEIEAREKQLKTDSENFENNLVKLDKIEKMKEDLDFQKILNGDKDIIDQVERLHRKKKNGEELAESENILLEKAEMASVAYDKIVTEVAGGDIENQRKALEEESNKKIQSLIDSASEGKEGKAYIQMEKDKKKAQEDEVKKQQEIIDLIALKSKAGTQAEKDIIEEQIAAKKIEKADIKTSISDFESDMKLIENNEDLIKKMGEATTDEERDAISAELRTNFGDLTGILKEGLLLEDKQTELAKNPPQFPQRLTDEEKEAIADNRSIGRKMLDALNLRNSIEKRKEKKLLDDEINGKNSKEEEKGTGFISAIGDKISGSITKALTSIWSGIIKSVKGAFFGLGMAIIGIVQTYWDEIKPYVEKIWEGLKNAWKNISDFFIGIWDWIVSKLPAPMLKVLGIDGNDKHIKESNDKHIKEGKAELAIASNETAKEVALEREKAKKAGKDISELQANKILLMKKGQTLRAKEKEYETNWWNPFSERDDEHTKLLNEQSSLLKNIKTLRKLEKGKLEKGKDDANKNPVNIVQIDNSKESIQTTNQAIEGASTGAPSTPYGGNV